MAEIPLALLETDPMNIRDATKIDDEFRDSIQKGIIEPLVVRPVGCIEDKKALEKLRAEGKQYAVVVGARRLDAARQAGLEAVPCLVRELKDLEALALSIAENRHRKDIPAWRWAEIVRDLYGRLEGSKEERVRKMVEMTGMGRSTIQEYLLLSELPTDFKARLKKPEERSFSEKEALARTPLAASEKTASFAKNGKNLPPSELEHLNESLPRVPERVMVKLVQDEDFRRLMKKNPAKAHELASRAAEKGQERVGEVLRLVREQPPRPERKPATVPYLELTLEVAYKLGGKEILEGLEEYRRQHNLPDMTAAANDILLAWIREKTGVDYPELPMAIGAIITRYLEANGYAKTGKEVSA